MGKILGEDLFSNANHTSCFVEVVLALIPNNITVFMLFEPCKDRRCHNTHASRQRGIGTDLSQESGQCVQQKSAISQDATNMLAGALSFPRRGEGLSRWQCLP